MALQYAGKLDQTWTELAHCAKEGLLGTSVNPKPKSSPASVRPSPPPWNLPGTQTQQRLQTLDPMSSEETEANSEHSHADIVLGASICANTALGSFISTATSTFARQWRPIVSYALVDLYPRNRSTAPLLAQLRSQLGDIDIRQELIYRVRKIGYRWKAIVSWASRESDQPLTGILLALENASR